MDAIEQHRCDACPGRAGARITLIPSLGYLYSCRHHARAWSMTLESKGAEFETFEMTELQTTS